MNSPEPGVAYGYIRVSTGRQEYSLEYQEKAVLEAYDRDVKPRGYRWGGIYRDEGVSAFKKDFDRREAASLLHKELRRGDCIIATKLDRVFRSRWDSARMMKRWGEMDIWVYIPGSGINTGTAQGRLLFAILSDFAEFESALISERTREGLKMCKKHHIPIGKRPPRIGFRYVGADGHKRLIKTADYDTTQKIVEWRLAGSTLEAIAIHLQKRGIKTDAGRTWSIQRVKRAYYRLIDHHIKDGWIRFRGISLKRTKVYEWIWNALPAEKLESIRDTYRSLGRESEVPCAASIVRAPATGCEPGRGTTNVPSVEATGISTVATDCKNSQGE